MMPFAICAIQALYASSDDWIKDGAPCLNNALTLEIRKVTDEFRSMRERQRSTPGATSGQADQPRGSARATSATATTTAQRKRNMAFCNQVKKIEESLADRLAACDWHTVDSLQSSSSYMELGSTADLRWASDLLKSCAGAISSSAVDQSLGRLFQLFSRMSVLTARTRASAIACEAKIACEKVLDESTNSEILSRGLRAMADMASMCELVRDIRAAPLSNDPEIRITEDEQFSLGHGLATLLRNVPLLACVMKDVGTAVAEPCNAQDVRAGMATLLREDAPPSDPSEAVRHLAKQMSGWRNLRERVTSTVVDKYVDLQEGEKKGKDGEWARTVAAPQLRSSLEFCSDVLPVMANELRQLRDALEFEWSAPTQRSEDDRHALKFLVAFLEHEEFMTHTTTAMVDLWFDKKTASQPQADGAKALTTTAAVARPQAGVEGSEPGPATEKTARPPNMSKAQWGKLKKKLEREAQEAQKQRVRTERSKRHADGAELTSVGQQRAAGATSTTTAPTADIAIVPLRGSTRSDAGSVTAARLPSRALADLKAGTTDLDHSEFLMKRWSGIREALDQAEIHCHARYCSTREFREIEGAEAATTRAREALGRAQSHLRDADVVLAQSSHREQLKAEHRPHAAKHSDLTAKVRAMEARVEAVAAAKPLLTAQEFIDQWLSGGFKLSPVRGDTRIAHDTRGRPLCKILARPTQDLGGYSQQHMQIHFHMDRRSTAEYGHQVREGDLLMVGGCPIVSVKLGSHEYNTGPGFFRLWFSREQIRHLTDMLACAFPAGTARSSNPAIPG